MPTVNTPVFQTNPNKDFLRSGFDAELVERWYRRCGHPLKYLGLPASEMLDILAWQRFLGRFTTIEREENQQHLMFLRANVRDVEHRLHSLYGEFDEILLSGRDRYGTRPEWPYDLVNLDYFGGLIYPGLARPRALRKLISNQSDHQHSFMLIVTQHLRDGDTVGEKSSFLEDLGRTLTNTALDTRNRSKIDRLIGWYADAATPDAARQALYMNVTLREFGESHHFDVFCRPAIIYTGTGNCSMIHFVTEFNVRPNVGHKTASSQSLIDVIRFDLKQVRDGSLRSVASAIR
jgi:hypothetical protein